MIQLKISHLDHSAKLTFPAKYERVVLALWSIGLDHDPEKYTLRRLGAEFLSPLRKNPIWFGSSIPEIH